MNESHEGNPIIKQEAEQPPTNKLPTYTFRGRDKSDWKDIERRHAANQTLTGGVRV